MSFNALTFSPLFFPALVYFVLPASSSQVSIRDGCCGIRFSKQFFPENDQSFFFLKTYHLRMHTGNSCKALLLGKCFFEKNYCRVAIIWILMSAAEVTSMRASFRLLHLKTTLSLPSNSAIGLSQKHDPIFFRYAIDFKHSLSWVLRTEHDPIMLHFARQL